MIKIVLVSDNHFNSAVLKYILYKEQDADMYLHCGDSEMTMKELLPFVSVKGNNDYDYEMPRQRFFDVLGHRILMLHGDPYVSSISDRGLIEKAKKEKADVVFYGHTHRYDDHTSEGIRMINPGSCNMNRDMTLPSYAKITIDEGYIDVQRIDIDIDAYMK